MEVKCSRNIIWDDLPGIENPHFARREIERRFRDGPIGIRHIWGMDELLRDRRPGLLGSPDTRQVMDWFLERIDNGTFVLVYAPHERPVHPALCWEKGARKARSSRWQILGHGQHELGQSQSPQLAGTPDGHWIADPELPMLPRLHIEEWIERGCSDRALNCGLPEFSWWDRLLGGNREVEERFFPKALGSSDGRQNGRGAAEIVTPSPVLVKERVMPTGGRAEQDPAPVEERVVPTDRQDPVPVTEANKRILTGLGDDVDDIVNRSPSLKADIEALRRDEDPRTGRAWEIEYGAQNAGSWADRERRKIVIDSAYTPAVAAAVLSHEVGHATYKVPVDRASREAMVNHYLADEGAATMSNIRFSREVAVQSQGQVVVPVPGQPQNVPQYNAIYNQYLVDGDAAAARRAIGEIYRAGEVTSTTGQAYGDYYGDFYDNWKARQP